MNRRSFTLALPGSLVAAGAVRAAAADSTPDALRRQFPNAVLRDQTDRPLRFYDDLVKGKTVLINFMFTTCGDFCPRATSNLAGVQRLLGAQLGREVRMISITVDPENDTPPRLARFAAEHHARPGWYFLTGSREAVDDVRTRLGAGGEDKMQHTGVVTIGNEPAGRWKHFYVLSSAAKLAEAAHNIAALPPLRN
jgi:protein SCO1/2